MQINEKVKNAIHFHDDWFGSAANLYYRLPDCTSHISDNWWESSSTSSFDDQSHSKALAALQYWKTCEFRLFYFSKPGPTGPHISWEFVWQIGTLYFYLISTSSIKINRRILAPGELLSIRWQYYLNLVSIETTSIIYAELVPLFFIYRLIFSLFNNTIFWGYLKFFIYFYVPDNQQNWYFHMPEFSRISWMYYSFSVQQYLGEISKNFRKVWKLFWILKI